MLHACAIYYRVFFIVSCEQGGCIPGHLRQVVCACGRRAVRCLYASDARVCDFFFSCLGQGGPLLQKECNLGLSGDIEGTWHPPDESAGVGEACSSAWWRRSLRKY
jgi:hypothetical protein